MPNSHCQYISNIFVSTHWRNGGGWNKVNQIRPERKKQNKKSRGEVGVVARACGFISFTWETPGAYHWLKTYTHTERERVCRTTYTVAFCTCTPIFETFWRRRKGGAKWNNFRLLNCCFVRWNFRIISSYRLLVVVMMAGGGRAAGGSVGGRQYWRGWWASQASSSFISLVRIAAELQSTPVILISFQKIPSIRDS